MEQSIFSLNTESLRYNRYFAKIQRLKRLMHFVKAHRIAVMAAVLILAGSLCAFLLSIGSFSGVIESGDLVYGDAPQGTLTAFLSKYRYQYASMDANAVWSDSVPNEPGQYRVRGVSRNGFGINRYSKETTLTLLPRPLEVQIQDGSYVYGDFSLDSIQQSTQLHTLAEGDRMYAIDFDLNQSENGTYLVSLKELAVHNAAGQDVTACYRITAREGSYSILPRPVTLCVLDAQKLYDGLEWTGAKWELAAGTLAQGDDIQVAFSPAPATAGIHSLVPDPVIRNSSGQDVTDRYQISVQAGKLTVHPRPITVSTGGGEKLYDGKPLTVSQWSIMDGSPLEGHSLTGKVTGSQTAAGESDNTIELRVQDETGLDVTANYDLIVKPGTLKVNPIVLRFETDGGEKVYDGTALYVPGCRQLSGQILSGHRLKYWTGTGPTHVGTADNPLIVYVFDANGDDVTAEGYQIEVDHGKLTVTPRPITIASESAEKLYDGYPLTCHVYQVLGDGFNFGLHDELVRKTYFTGEQTEVGSSSNTFTVQITDYEGEVTTHNYAITYVYGTLTVKENPDYTGSQPGGTHGSGSGGGDDESDLLFGNILDGSAVDYPQNKDDILYAQVDGLLNLKKPKRFYFRYLSHGDYTGSGWAPAVLYETADKSPLHYAGSGIPYSGKEPMVKIHRLNNCPALLPYYCGSFTQTEPLVNDCYYIEDSLTYNMTVNPSLTYDELKDQSVNKNYVNQELAYRRFVYEQYLQIPESTLQSLLQWAKENGIRSDSPTLVTDIQNAIINAAAYNPHGESYPDGVDVAVYFLTQAKEGICQHFATAATMVYRAFGIPARYTVGFMDEVVEGVTTQLTSQDAHAWVEIYVDGVGWVAMEVTSGFSDSIKNQLVIQAYSATKVYDGTAFDAYDIAKYSIAYGYLLPGHRLEVKLTNNSYPATPGKYENRVAKCTVYDEYGNDVTAQYYQISLVPGTLEILKRPITVTMGSSTKVYDGTELFCGEYWISQGSLLVEHEMEMSFSSVITEPGSIPNQPGVIHIYWQRKSDMIEVTAYYDITTVDGVLTVTPE